MKKNKNYFLNQVIPPTKVGQLPKFRLYYHWFEDGEMYASVLESQSITKVINDFVRTDQKDKACDGVEVAYE